MASAQKSEPRVRNQVVTPRQSRRVARSRTSRTSRTGTLNMVEILRTARLFAKPAAVLAAAVLLIVAYNTVAGSPLFELRRIEISGIEPSLRAEVEQAARRAVGNSKLLDIDLQNVRQKVETIPRVRDARVARILPDALSIEVSARRPTVVVRRKSQAIVWLDEDGVELGEITDIKPEGDGAIPPIASGFSEGARTPASVAEDRERIALYKQIEAEFKSGPEPVWNLIDEIDLTTLRYVSMRLASPPVTIVVGGKDFRNRFDTAIKVLGAIRRSDFEMLSRFRVQDPESLISNADNIDFIDTSRADRIVLNFSGKEKKQGSEVRTGAGGQGPGARN
ncbi:MAG TPA: FtsQ-type POTRA domain-containing protein [Blastocatellia bacterium]|nr:FtsQ-type POTRA domain-containing protein [Blastocatellia bacterium]